MDTALIILIVIAIALLLLRVYEVRKQRLTLFSKIVRGADVHLLKIIELFRRGVLFTKEGALKIKVIIFKVLKVWFVASITYLKKKIDIVHDRLNGKGKIKEKGSVSFFLRSVSEHKEAMRKENIE